MKNITLNTFNTDLDFAIFIENNFKKIPKKISFSETYNQRKAPDSFLKNFTESEIKNIKDRELIRDNIFIDYKFDIFEFPIVVFYENNKSKKLKPFKKFDEANNYSKMLLQKDISSLLISIMNRNIECKLFSN